MADVTVVQALVDGLESDKPAFLERVRGRVRSFIESRGTECLALVSRTDEGRVLETHKPSLTRKYAGRLIAFCRGVPYDNHTLDSALTEPTVALVTEEFERLYHDRGELFADAISAQLIRDEVFARGLIDSVIESRAIGTLTDQMKSFAARQLLIQLQAGFHAVVTSSVMQSVGHSVAAAVATPIAKQLTVLLIKALHLHMKTIIVKALSSVAVKKAILIYTKKFIAAAILAGVAKAIALKLGISATGAAMIILLPLVLAYLAREIYTFPRHLGEKVSERVVHELDSSYRALNQQISSTIADALLLSGMSALATELGKNSELGEAIAAFLGSDDVLGSGADIALA